MHMCAGPAEWAVQMPRPASYHAVTCSAVRCIAVQFGCGSMDDSHALLPCVPTPCRPCLLPCMMWRDPPAPPSAQMAPARATCELSCQRLAHRCLPAAGLLSTACAKRNWCRL